MAGLLVLFPGRLDKRREKGLPTPTDYKKHQAATCIQVPQKWRHFCIALDLLLVEHCDRL